MGVKEERAFGWGIPLKIILICIVLFLIYRYGSWMIMGAKTINVQKDIMITPVLNNSSEIDTAVTEFSYYYVDIQAKKIYCEETTELDMKTVSPALSVLSKDTKKIKSASLSDDEIKYLLSFSSNEFSVPQDAQSNYTIEYNTDRVPEYHMIRSVSYKDLARIINKF